MSMKNSKLQRFYINNVSNYSYTLVVTATDQAEPVTARKTATASVLIRVKDGTTARRTSAGAHSPPPPMPFTTPSPRNVPKRSTPAAPPAAGPRFPEGAQVFTVPSNGRRGRVIGQIRVENPGGGSLAWSMRHRYRHGGLS